MEGVYSGTAVGTVAIGRPSWEFVLGLIGLKFTASVFKIELAEHAGVDAARNKLVSWFLRTNFLSLLLLDADVIVHPLTIERLRSWEVPIVSAICVQRTPPYAPVDYRDHKADGAYRHYASPEPLPEGRWFANIEDWMIRHPLALNARSKPVVLQPRPVNALVRVNAVGAHCLLVDREVFSQRPQPWFEPGVSFGAGLVDRSVVVGHEVKHLAGLVDYAVYSSAYRIEE